MNIDYEAVFIELINTSLQVCEAGGGGTKATLTWKQVLALSTVALYALRQQAAAIRS